MLMVLKRLGRILSGVEFQMCWTESLSSSETLWVWSKWNEDGGYTNTDSLSHNYIAEGLILRFKLADITVHEVYS